MRLATRLRNGAAGTVAMAAVRRAQLEVSKRRGGVVFDVDGRMGMGATLTHLTLAAALADRLGLAATLGSTNPLYAQAPGEDWVPRFFERLRPAAPPGSPRIAIRNDVEQRFLGSDAGLSLADGLAVFSRHFRFVPFLQVEAAGVYGRLLAGRNPLAVHYRGTDKVGDEAPGVERARAVAAISAQIARGGHRAVFLATDEPAFGDALRGALHVPIASYARPELSVVAGQPIHFADADGYWKGVDALVNILLLARCDAIVRTASYLSGWARVLNPRQKTLLLSRPFSETRFPDARIVSDLPA